MGRSAKAMARFKPTILLLCLAVLRTEGSCFGRDASFTRGAKPVVTQPSRNDPSKVMVDWSKIVTNANCVDKFVVWMWPDGTERTGMTTVKKEVSKTTMSAIMDMEACVNYRFAVELDEKEMTGNKKFSGEQLFKTAGETKVVRLSASDFTVGYHWDPVRQVSDLRLASISFPRSAIEHASCLDYIQVTGEEVRAGRPTLSRQASTASMTGRVQWSHLPPSTYFCWRRLNFASKPGFRKKLISREFRKKHIRHVIVLKIQQWVEWLRFSFWSSCNTSLCKFFAKENWSK